MTYSANNSVFCLLKNSLNWNAVYTFMSDISTYSIGFVKPWHCVKGGGGSDYGGGNAMLVMAVVVMRGGMP